MIGLIQLELFKLKSKKVWLCVLLFLVAEFIWSLWAALSYSDTYDIWCYLLLQIPSLNTLLMPILISILASRLSNNEYKGSTFKLLNTLVNPKRLYSAKFICSSLYLLLATLGQVLCMIVTSFIVGLTEPMPLDHIASFILTTLLVNLCLLAFYQTLSLLFANQVITLIAGLAGGFIGLFSLFFPPILQRLFLPSYYSILDTVLLITHMETKTFSMQYEQLDLISVGIMFLVGLSLFIVGQIIFYKKEV